MENFFKSDEFMVMTVPTVVYWVYSGFYELVGGAEKYKLHSRKDEETKNLVSKQTVVKGVLFQQAIQATIAWLVFKLTKGDNVLDTTNLKQPFTVIALQFFIAMLVFDTWQYFIHRYMHFNKFMYRNFHSWHHRLIAPYAYGAQYNHPIDGILTETLAGAMAFFISRMSARTAIFFFSFATIKGIDDHCGLMLPYNPFHMLFRNNTAYHEIHHQLASSKCNFAQPFFVMWDRVLGTYDSVQD